MTGLLAGRRSLCAAAAVCGGVVSTLDAMLLALSSLAMARRAGGGAGRAPKPSPPGPSPNVMDGGRLNRWYAVAVATAVLCSSVSRWPGADGGLSLTAGAMYDSMTQQSVDMRRRRRRRRRWRSRPRPPLPSDKGRRYRPAGRGRRLSETSEARLQHGTVALRL